MSIPIGTQLIDSLGPVIGGMNSGIAPLLLPRTQLAFANNVTVRGTYAKPRPPFQIRELSAAGKTLVASALAIGPFQGAGFYNPDVGDETLIASIAGRLFQFHVTLTPVTVDEITIHGNPSSSTAEQVWMWQSEKWMIITDGTTQNPVFFDGTSSRRSNYATPVNHTTTITTAFVVPAVGSVIAGVVVGSTVGMVENLQITITNIGTFLVQAVTSGTTVDLINLTAQPNKTVAATSGAPPTPLISWITLGDELPPGRMGAYGMGRNAMCLVDGKQFVFGDQTGGSSGTISLNYRDAVLHITENNYLAGGGLFSVPGSIGDIRAMIFSANLDASLGQGPLQIFTHSHVFSCQVPVDRLTWQDVTNPILSESLISNGALGQWSTVIANSDILFRAIDGIRSLILARREFGTWGNVPESREIDSILARDSTDLLRFGSAITWDNRLLMTALPTPSDQGFYHKALIALNFDPLSSLRGKEPSVYDGPWTGLQVLQMITGEFQERPRAFAFTLNTLASPAELEIYEFLKSEIPAKDNGTIDIQCEMHSACLFNYPDNDPRSMELKRLVGGEIYVDQIAPGTTANFQVYYKPDQYPCFLSWHQWSECAGTAAETESDVLLRKPQFRPEMGLGEPNPRACDPITNRPFREGFNFQIRIIWSNCRFLGARFKVVTAANPYYSPMVCKQICPPTT